MFMFVDVGDIGVIYQMQGFSWVYLYVGWILFIKVIKVIFDGDCVNIWYLVK